jgi:hypothetical protein
MFFVCSWRIANKQTNLWFSVCFLIAFMTTTALKIPAFAPLPLARHLSIQPSPPSLVAVLERHFVPETIVTSKLGDQVITRAVFGTVDQAQYALLSLRTPCHG